jgi:hypothetical protein
MHKIPYLDHVRYETLYNQFLADEATDLDSSETVLGESYFASPVKTIFEQVLLVHIRSSGSIPCETFVPKQENLPEYAYCEPHESNASEVSKVYSLASKLLQEALKECDLHKTVDLEISAKWAQTTYANVVILHANRLLGFK